MYNTVTAYHLDMSSIINWYELFKQISCYGWDALFDYRLNTAIKQLLHVNKKVTYKKTLYTSGTISLWSLATWTHLSSSGRSKSILYSAGTVKLSG